MKNLIKISLTLFILNISILFSTELLYKGNSNQFYKGDLNQVKEKWEKSGVFDFLIAYQNLEFQKISDQFRATDRLEKQFYKIKHGIENLKKLQNRFSEENLNQAMSGYVGLNGILYKLELKPTSKENEMSSQIFKLVGIFNPPWLYTKKNRSFDNEVPSNYQKQRKIKTINWLSDYLINNNIKYWKKMKENSINFEQLESFFIKKFNKESYKDFLKSTKFKTKTAIIEQADCLVLKAIINSMPVLLKKVAQNLEVYHGQTPKIKKTFKQVYGKKNKQLKKDAARKWFNKNFPHTIEKITPISEASIGSVYKITLNNGKNYAIKITHSNATVDAIKEEYDSYHSLITKEASKTKGAKPIQFLTNLKNKTLRDIDLVLEKKTTEALYTIYHQPKLGIGCQTIAEDIYNYIKDPKRCIAFEYIDGYTLEKTFNMLQKGLISRDNVIKIRDRLKNLVTYQLCIAYGRIDKDEMHDDIHTKNAMMEKDFSCIKIIDCAGSIDLTATITGVKLEVPDHFMHSFKHIVEIPRDLIEIFDLSGKEIRITGLLYKSRKILEKIRDGSLKRSPDILKNALKYSLMPVKKLNIHKNFSVNIEKLYTSGSIQNLEEIYKLIHKGNISYCHDDNSLIDPLFLQVTRETKRLYDFITTFNERARKSSTCSDIKLKKEDLKVEQLLDTYNNLKEIETEEKKEEENKNPYGDTSSDTSEEDKKININQNNNNTPVLILLSSGIIITSTLFYIFYKKSQLTSKKKPNKAYSHKKQTIHYI